MVVFGKSLGGGIAIGAYGMTAEHARFMEQNLDRDGAVVESVGGLATGGTLYANALSLAAARATLEQVLTEPAFERTARLGARLAEGIQRAIDDRALPWRAQSLYCRAGYSLAPELPRNAEQARAASDFELNAAQRLFLANRGIWEAISTAGPAASVAMTEQDVDRYLGVFDRFLQELLE